MTQDFPDLDPAAFEELGPKEVELQMRYLSRELSETQKGYAQHREDYAKAKADYTVKMAKSRDKFARSGTKSTSQEREDLALIENEEAYGDLLMQEAIVDVYKGKIERLKAQSDLVRSVGASVRESMKIGDN